MLNEDYRDILQALNKEHVNYILVGAYAIAAHGYPRATMDIDIWVEPESANASAVIKALKRFGAPLASLRETDILESDTIFQIGVAPRRIDIITGVSGLDFEKAFNNAIRVKIDEIEVKILSLQDLIINKKASGRLKDLADVELLESLKDSRQDG